MLNKNFLHTETELFKIPISRLIAGLLAGLFFAFCFYALLYLTRESFRFVSLTADYDLWILSDKEHSFYNLVFAFISVIFAQSVCFSFWLNRPQQFFSKQKLQRKTILNDQSTLNTYFLLWFSELAVMYGLTFGPTFQGGFYAFSFYPKYNYVFVLILLVLFLQTWNSIRRTNKKQSLKWMFCSAILCSAIAFGLSKVNLIDYRGLNNIALQKNIAYQFKLEVPASDSYDCKVESQSLMKDIYVVRNKQNEHSTPKIFIDNHEVTLNNAGATILEFQNTLQEADIYLCTYRLHIDKTIKMSFVTKIQHELMNVNALRVAYSVVPTDAELNKNYYKNFVFLTRLPGNDLMNADGDDRLKALNRFANVIEITNPETDVYTINGQPCRAEGLKKTIKACIISNSDYIVCFHINGNSVFSDYINVLTKTKAAINELRNEYALLTFRNEFVNLTDEQSHEAIKKYGYRIFDVTNEMNTGRCTE